MVHLSAQLEHDVEVAELDSKDFYDGRPKLDKVDECLHAVVHGVEIVGVVTLLDGADQMRQATGPKDDVVASLSEVLLKKGQIQKGSQGELYRTFTSAL